MAAPPAKQSPSNQKMHQSEDTVRDGAKPPPPSTPASSNSNSNNNSNSTATQQQGQQQRQRQRSMLKDPPPSSLVPTYRSSENSENYRLAKQLLNADNFEEALSLVEQQLIETTAAVRSGLVATATATARTRARARERAVGSSSSSSSSGGMHVESEIDSEIDVEIDVESEIELHESLAPLHYLYGTTLLYSLEESGDDGNGAAGAMAMVTAAATATATTNSTTTTTSTEAAPDPSNPWAHLGESGGAASDNNNTNNNTNNNNTPDELAEDIQIAWENLEAARTIVEKMLLQAATGTGTGTATTTNDRSEQEVAKLQLDLAQIHLREGDLQRINGNYTSAVGDYSSCLEILLRHNHTRDEKGDTRNLDRKIADTRFNLGLTYLTSSSDLQKELADAGAGAGADAGAGAGESGSGDVTGDGKPSASASASANANADAGADEKRKAALLLAREHCEKGIQHQVDCARTFCGILAGLCGVEPETIWSASASVSTDDKDGGDTAAAEKPRPAGPKTTGLDDGVSVSISPGAAAASQTLAAWRAVAATLVVEGADEDTLARIDDIRQLLDEIQETIDEAERSQEGVRQAAEIRVRAQKAAAAAGGNDFETESTNPDGSTTTIGFGAASASVFSAAASTASAVATSAAPMMVVKKKKKRSGDVDVDDTTKPAECKRAKTDE